MKALQSGHGMWDRWTDGRTDGWSETNIPPKNFAVQGVRRPMITHTSGSHQIPSQNKTKSKLRIKKIAKNSNFEILQETLHATHLLKLLDKMYKYVIDPTRTVGATDRTQDAGRMDGRMEWNQYSPQ